MKGLVFTEFFRHVEATHGADTLDAVIDAAGLSHDGIYTSGGTYPFDEMVALVSGLCRVSGAPMPQVLEAFGEHCFAQWVHYAPAFFADKPLFDIYRDIDHFHEVEVRKLYPDAELPTFRMESRDARHMTIGYYSCKPLADLAIGVMKGAARYRGRSVAISAVSAVHEGKSYVRLAVSLLDQMAEAA